MPKELEKCVNLKKGWEVSAQTNLEV